MELYQIKNRRELFIDDLLIWKADGLSRRVHEPHSHPPEPTLTAGYYMTMLRHEGKIHCYARRDFGEFTGENSPFTVKPGWIGEYTSYAQFRFRRDTGFLRCRNRPRNRLRSGLSHDS